MLIPPYGLITQKLERRQLKPTDIMKSEGQSNLEGKKIGRYEGRLFTLKSLSSNPPTLLSSTNHPSPLPLFHKGKALHTSLKRNAAFTLAEVLITLGIIGIVAALTIPALITNYQKNETLNKLKKTYSIFSQAFKQAELNEGESEYWDFNLSHKEFYMKYIKQYLNVANEYIDKPLPIDMDYYTPNGRINNDSGGHKATSSPKIFLNDGTFFTVLKASEDSYSIAVNLNGYSHPNRWGRDIFAFAIVKGKGFVPYGQYSGVISDTGEMVGSFGDSLDRDKITGTGNSRACNKENDGIWCAALIMFDGWEIKDDYPW